VIFQADVNRQDSAYATGVLVMMLSASVAVLIWAVRAHRRGTTWVAGGTALLLAYAFVANEVQAPIGLAISGCFVLGIVVASFSSRVLRSTELRSERVVLDETARRFIAEADTDRNGQIMIVAHRPGDGDSLAAYAYKEHEQRRTHNLTTREAVLFLEMRVEDASDFADTVEVTGHQVGIHKVLRGRSSAVPNAIAAFLLHVQEEFGVHPHCYFGWTEGNPLRFLARYVLLGEGDTAPMTREVLRRAERDPDRRPAVHVGG
jgi:hypothetical protein